MLGRSRINNNSEVAKLLTLRPAFADLALTPYTVHNGLASIALGTLEEVGTEPHIEVSFFRDATLSTVPDA